MEQETRTKSIWRENRSLFESIGLTIAIGALFLAMPEQSNTLVAIRALQYIKLTWLFVIIICFFILAYQWLKVFVSIEKEALKINLDFDGNLVLLFLFIEALLLFEIFKYTWFQYQELLMIISRNAFVTGSVSALVINFYFSSSKKILLIEHKRKRLISQIGLTLAVSFLGSFYYFLAYTNYFLSLLIFIYIAFLCTTTTIFLSKQKRNLKSFLLLLLLLALPVIAIISNSILFKK